jgi:hypothetical protein
MSRSSNADGILAEVGNRIFNGGPVKKRIRRGMTGMRLLQPAQSNGNAAPRMDAISVRRKLTGLVKRSPQVLVRISGGGKSIRHIKAHLDYISRRGQIPLEDQNGEQLIGEADVEALRDEWRDGGFPIADEGQRKEAFNLILSMPAGTSEVAVLRAARDFARAEFGNFQYVMALHTMNSDPHQDPSPNPHVHLCVKATGLDGVRLNPRKGDLQRWRERFAEHLREHGVACEATRRLHRLQPNRGEKQSVRHKKARGESFARVGKGQASITRIERARAAELQLLSGYRQLAKVLANSTDTDDRKLAIGLAQRVRDAMPGVREVGRAAFKGLPNRDKE